MSDRGASIRIPVGTVENGWKGRLEDRRTASNADPYKVAAAIIKTTKKHCNLERSINVYEFLFSLFTS